MSRRHDNQAQPKNKISATARYLLLATLAVVVTLTTPGRVVSTHYNSTHESSQTILLYCLTLLALYILHGSDPGYLGTPASPTTMTARLDSTDAIDIAARESSHSAEITSGDIITEDDDNQALLLSRHDEETADRDESTEMSANNPLSSPSPALTTGATTTTAPRRNYCHRCHTSPPLRSHHCKDCNRCVSTFDHHCRFVNVCVGERNHARFLLFVLLQWAAFWQCDRVLARSSYGLWSLLRYNSHVTSREELLASLYVTLSKAFLYTMTVPAALVAILHVFFACSNSTTFEFAKASHLEYLRGIDIMALPFSQGNIIANLRLFIQRDEWFQSQRCCVCCRRQSSSSIVLTEWTPIQWPAPSEEDCSRDSEDWWNHPWRNKYWSCC
jgi:hypothetical protein